MSRSRIGAGLLALLMALSAAIGLAQNPPETEPDLAALRESVEALQRRVEKLEANQQNDLKQAVQQLTEQLDALEKLQTGGTTKPKETHHAAEEPASGMIERFEGHASQLRGVAISPDGHWGASTDSAGNLRIWDLPSRTGNKVFPIMSGRSTSTTRFSPDGKSLLVTGMSKAVMLDVGTWKPRWTASVTSAVAESVAFSPDGTMVALPDRNGLVILDVADGQIVKNLKVAPDIVKDVAFGPSGDELFIAGDYFANGTTPISYYGRLWNWKTGQERLRTPYRIRSAAWDIERGRLYAIGQENQVEEWNTNTGKRIRTWTETSHANRELELSGDGRYLALGLEGAVELWNTGTAKRIDHVELSDAKYSQRVALRDDGLYAMAASIFENTVWGVRFKISTPANPGEQAALPPSKPVAPDAETPANTRPVSPSGTSPPAAPSITQPAPDTSKIELPRGGIVPFEINRFARHEQPIKKMILSPDDRWIATTTTTRTRGNRVYVWEAATGRRRATIDVAHWQGELDIAFSPRSDLIAIAGTGKLQLTSTDDWTRQWEETFSGLNENTLFRVAFSPDGKQVALAGKLVLKIWNVETGKIEHDSKHEYSGVTQLQFNDTLAELMIVGSPSEPPRARRSLWFLDWKQNDARTLNAAGPVAHVRDVAWDLERNRIFAWRISHDIGEWDSQTGEKIRDWPGTDNVTQIALSGDGRFLAAGTRLGTVDLWEPESAQRIESLPVGVSRVDDLAISSDGSRFYVAEHDGLTLHTGTFLVPSRLDSDEAASRSENKRLRQTPGDNRIFNFTPNRHVPGPGPSIGAFVLAPDGKSAFVVTRRRGIEHWDLQSGESLLKPGAYQSNVPLLDLHCLPDGKFLAFLNMHERQIVVWNVETWRAVKKMGYPGDRPYQLAVSPDGKIAAAASLNRAIVLWDIETEGRLRSLSIGEPVFELAFSSDGQYLAGIGRETIRVWNVETGVQLHEERRQNPNSPRTERMLSFSPDEPPRLLISGVGVFWRDVENWRRGRSIDPPEGGEGPLKAGTFSPDGTKILAVGEERAYVWDAASGTELVNVPAASATAAVARFTPDGSQFLTMDKQGRIVFWPTPGYDKGKKSAMATAVVAPRP